MPAKVRPSRPRCLCTAFALVVAFALGNVTHVWRQLSAVSASQSEPPTPTAQDMLAALRHLTKAHRYLRNNAKASIELRHAVGILTAGVQRAGLTFRMASDSKSETAVQRSLEVCPEKWLGNMAGYPFYFTGHIRENCSNVPTFETLVTIVINAVHSTPTDALPEVFRDISSIYPKLPLIVGVSADAAEKTRKWVKQSGLDSVTIVESPGEASFLRRLVGAVPRAENEGAFWRRLSSMVTTKYALIARSVIRVLPDMRLERLVDAATYLHADVIGGAHRNESGHWSIGCYQTAMRNYAFRLIEGYDFSSNSCALCDYLSGPFLARTSLLKGAFDASLTGDSLFIDFFVALRNASETANFVSCPDVLFVVNERRLAESSRDRLTALAAKWELNRIVLPEGVTFAFSCAEANVKCSWLKGIAMPRCCIDELSAMTRELMRACVEVGVDCELEGGSVLGAYKFAGFLPWERDADINWRVSDYTRLLGTAARFKARGFTLKEDSEPAPLSDARQAKCFMAANFSSDDVNCGFFLLRSPNWRVELWGVKYTASDAYRHRFGLNATLALLDGDWVLTYPNPVWFARNIYGDDALGHVEHWRALGVATGWVLYPESSFLPCPRKGYHGCLDQFLPTGSLQFMETWV